MNGAAYRFKVTSEAGLLRPTGSTTRVLHAGADGQAALQDSRIETPGALPHGLEMPRVLAWFNDTGFYPGWFPSSSVMEVSSRISSVGIAEALEIWAHNVGCML